MNVHYKIDNSGNYVTEDTIFGWCIVLNGNGYALDEMSKRNFEEILNHLPQFVQKQIREDICGSKVEFSEIRPAAISQISTEPNVRKIKDSTESELRCRLESTSQLNNISVEFAEWVSNILDRNSVKDALKNAFVNNDHRSWVLDMYPTLKSFI